MKLFANKRCGSYSGGLCIVAANSVEEAHSVAINSFKANDNYLWEYFNEYYSIDGWFELPNCKCNCTVPTLIVENGYTE